MQINPLRFSATASLSLLACLAASGWLRAAEIRAIDHPAGGPRAALLKGHALPAGGLNPAQKGRQAIVFPGENVIPQLVDGAGWQTSFTFANLDSKTLTFEIYFFSSAGAEMPINVPGVGLTSGIRVTLPVTETISFATQGTKSDLSQGFAYIDRGAPGDVLGGIAIFRQRVPDRPDFEAVVPFVSEFDKRFVLLYDNSANFVTAMAIANPSLDTINVDATIRDEDANVLTTGRITLGPFQHTAFTLPGRWSTTAGRRGVIEFRSTGWGASVLGLRFNPGGAFTSFHVLSNFDWVQTAQ